MSTLTLNRARFDNLANKVRALSEQHRDFRSKLARRYGSCYETHWLSAKDRKEDEKLRERCSRHEDKLFDALRDIASRNWMSGVPVHWIVENVTYDMATTRAALPVPPTAWGCHPSVSTQFAAALKD